jgi:hypothetical protein
MDSGYAALIHKISLILPFEFAYPLFELHGFWLQYLEGVWVILFFPSYRRSLLHAFLGVLQCSRS